jgi:hypothetical protein
MRLPKSVQEIADVIGRERALYLVGQLPRCERRDKRYPGAMQSEVILYVPTAQRLTVTHDLVRILGWNDAVKMCKHFGGEILKPASCSEIYRSYRDRIITDMWRAGMSTSHIAAIVGVTDRHVRNVCVEIPREEIPTAANDNAPIRKQGRVNGPTGANAVSRGEADGRTSRHRDIQLG